MKAAIFIAMALFFITSCNNSKNGEPSNNVITNLTNSKEAAYQKLVEQYGQDYDACKRQGRKENACQPPEIFKNVEMRDNLNVELILDSSNSMAEKAGNTTKMEAAKQALTGFVAALPKNANVALRVYGHKGGEDNIKKAESCASTELVYTFQPLDKTKFNQAVRSFKPAGWTPVAGALKASQADFTGKNAEQHTNVIYMVSDGVETCGGDPVAAARALHESDVKAIINVIGFDVDDKGREQLKQVAAAGGGEYLEARDNAALMELFNKSVAESYRYFNCVYAEQYGQFNSTHAAEYEEFNCIHAKMYEEYNKLTAAALQQYNGKKIDQATLDYIRDKAAEKRDRIGQEAQAEKDKSIDASRQSRDESIENAREKRDTTIGKVRNIRDRN
jgi:Ca-activated chloride channel homolog